MLGAAWPGFLCSEGWEPWSVRDKTCVYLSSQNFGELDMAIFLEHGFVIFSLCLTSFGYSRPNNQPHKPNEAIENNCAGATRWIGHCIFKVPAVNPVYRVCLINKIFRLKSTDIVAMLHFELIRALVTIAILVIKCRAWGEESSFGRIRVTII